MDGKYVVLLWPLIFVHNVHVRTLPKEKLSHLNVILTDSHSQWRESILNVKFAIRILVSSQCC